VKEICVCQLKDHKDEYVFEDNEANLTRQYLKNLSPSVSVTEVKKSELPNNTRSNETHSKSINEFNNISFQSQTTQTPTIIQTQQTSPDPQSYTCFLSEEEISRYLCTK